MSGATSKQPMNAVQVNAVWEEACKKEARSIVLGDTFQIADARRRESGLGWDSVVHALMPA